MSYIITVVADISLETTGLDEFRASKDLEEEDDEDNDDAAVPSSELESASQMAEPGALNAAQTHAAE